MEDIINDVLVQEALATLALDGDERAIELCKEYEIEIKEENDDHEEEEDLHVGKAKDEDDIGEEDYVIR